MQNDDENVAKSGGGGLRLDPNSLSAQDIAVLLAIIKKYLPPGGVTSIIAGTDISIDQATGDVTISFSNPGFISANQTITLSGPVTGSGATSITTSITDVSISGGIVTMTSKFQLPVGTNLF